MTTGLMWFRRDMRLHDNRALHWAVAECDRVLLCFCFDREILDKLHDRADRRVEFIYQSLTEMQDALKRLGKSVIVRHGRATEVVPRLAAELKVDRVYANHDYEPRRLERDEAVADALRKDGRELRTFKDHVIFERDEILTKGGEPFKVYTPYLKAWRESLRREDHDELPIDLGDERIAGPRRGVSSDPWTLGDLGFQKTDLRWPGGTKAGRGMLDSFLDRIDGYADARDVPSADATSRLSVHLRFGTISIREVVRAVMPLRSNGAKKWLDEIVWREFYNMILHHFPHTEHDAFQSQYDDLEWRENEADFEAWCAGRTGYPMVDAGMRELNTTGYMHNRVRMIVASFLTKDLRIHWKRGERYFARLLLDYDLSQNLGGWQWSASTGTDAQPYFRIFNPILQSKRFDLEGEYIRRYVRELREFPSKYIHAPWEANASLQREAGCIVGEDYPEPIVDHVEARAAALEMFKRAKGETGRSGSSQKQRELF